MKLVELHVDGFGILHDYYLGPAALGADLTVVFGLNEAGKSTLLSFIRAILFGFKQPGQPVPEALSGGRLGGHLVLQGRDGDQYRIERTAGGAKGKLRLTMPDGTEGDEKLFTGRVLPHLSYPVYKNVFAFGMEELRRLENLSHDEIGAYVYGAGTGIEPRRLTAAVDTLRKEMDALFTPRGRTVPRLNRALGELAKLEAGLRKLREIPAEYRDLRAQQAAAREQRADLQATCRKMQAEITFLEKLVRAASSWQALAEARAVYRGLPQVDSFPASGVARLEALEEKVHIATVARTGHKEEMEPYKEEMKGLNPDPALLGAAGEIRKLSGERSLLENLIAEAEQVAGDVNRAAEECAAGLERLGPGWDEERLLGLDISIVIRQQVENHRDLLDDAGEREKTLENEMRQREDSVAGLIRRRDKAREALEMHRVPEPPVDTPPAVRAEMLDRLEADTRRLAALHAACAHLDERKGDIAARMQALEREEQNIVPPRPVWAAPLALVLVSAVAGIGWVVTPSAAVFALLIGLPAAVAIEAARRRSLARYNKARENLARERGELNGRLADIGQKADKARSRAEMTARSLREAARQALGADAATDEEIQAARRGLAEEERALAQQKALSAALAGAEGDLEKEREQQRAQGQELQAARAARLKAFDEWDAWREKAGLDPGLEPTVVLSFIEAAEKGRELIKTREDRKQKAAALENRIETLTGRIAGLAQALGFPPVNTANAGQSLQTMQTAAEEARAQERRRVALIAECERLEKLVRACDREIGAREEEISALLQAAGADADDREDFRRRAAVFEKRRSLKETIKASKRELGLLAGDDAERKRLEQVLKATTPAQHQAQLQQAREKLEGLERERGDLDRAIGEYGARIAALETGEELAVALQKREMLYTRFNRRAGAWRVRALALRLLESAKEKYEMERQPAVLARASEYLEPMTAGRYRRVIAPVGQTDRLEIEDHDGVRLGAAQLSRGTAAQLFLAVRLALARQLAESGPAGLPLVLDDILVDFDGERLTGATRVLGRVAAAQQVLLFTCHRHIVKAVQKECPQAATLDLRQG